VTTVDERAVTDPVGTVVDLVTAIETALDPAVVTAVTKKVAAGRAKRRRLATALVQDAAVLVHGKSPAPKVVGELLIALRRAGATAVSAPRCASCSKELRSLQRRGQDWFCGPCVARPELCSACGCLRRVTFRDLQGRPRCAQCPQTDRIADPITAICTTVAAVSPDQQADAVAAAVRATVSSVHQQRRLAQALIDAPELLTGDGHLSPVRSVLGLIEILADAGAVGIVRPACGRCRRVVRLDKPLDGVRVCRSCIARTRAEPCSRCLAVREPATRDADGRPLCPDCLSRDPVNWEECRGCGRHRPVGARTADGPLCPSCLRPPVRTCAICGSEAPCEISKATGQPWCRACQKLWSRCTRCGEIKPVRGGTRHEPLCSTCLRPEQGFWQQCPACGSADRLRGDRCARCTLDARLQLLLAGPDSTLRPELQALKDALCSTERPVATHAWLSKTSAVTLLEDLARGARELSHAALDEFGPDKTVRHLRALLVASGSLPARDEYLARLEQWLDKTIASVTEAQDRYVVHRYATWHHLRRLRHRASPSGVTYGQAASLRRRTKAAIGFLELLARHGLTLTTCQQAHLDSWLADGLVPQRLDTGSFVRWAAANKLAKLDFPATRWHGPTGAIDADRRWQTARRLLHDDSLPASTRVAGLLVVLYAQHVADIARLTLDDVTITDEQVDITLGSVPITLPEPLDALVTQLAATRRGHAVSGHRTASPWLFPGGQPGQPISAYRLRERLATVGIAGSLRTTALFQLATELPAAILARTLGVHIQVAVQWQKASAGDWAAYAADVAQRNPHQHNSKAQS
jgi:hypothetical protein